MSLAILGLSKKKKLSRCIYCSFVNLRTLSVESSLISVKNCEKFAIGIVGDVDLTPIVTYGNVSREGST